MNDTDRERWRELLLRHRIPAGPGKGSWGRARNGEPSISDWWDRHAKPGLCWWCHRYPGCADCHGACRDCYTIEGIVITTEGLTCLKPPPVP